MSLVELEEPPPPPTTREPAAQSGSRARRSAEAALRQSEASAQLAAALRIAARAASGPISSRMRAALPDLENLSLLAEGESAGFTAEARKLEAAAAPG